MTDNRSALDSLYAALAAEKTRRAEARASLKAATRALERERGVEADKINAVDSARVAEFAAGIHDAVKRANASWDAEIIAEAATRAVATAEQARAAAVAELTAAERAVGAAADAILSAEAADVVSKGEQLLNELLGIGETLKLYLEDAQHIPINRLRSGLSSTQQRIRDVLERIEFACHGRDMPLNVLQPDSQQSKLNQAFSDFVVKRRSALMADAADPAPAERAA